MTLIIIIIAIILIIIIIAVIIIIIGLPSLTFPNIFYNFNVVLISVIQYTLIHFSMLFMSFFQSFLYFFLFWHLIFLFFSIFIFYFHFLFFIVSPFSTSLFSFFSMSFPLFYCHPFFSILKTVNNLIVPPFCFQVLNSVINSYTHL